MMNLLRRDFNARAQTVQRAVVARVQALEGARVASRKGAHQGVVVIVGGHRRSVSVGRLGLYAPATETGLRRLAPVH
jgi:hypothetical protein